MFKTFDLREYSVSLAGLPLDKGWAEGEVLRVEPESDAYSDKVGCGGDVTRSKTNDTRATATLIYEQTSDTNDLLSALHALDINSPSGAGVGAFHVRDRQGRTAGLGAHAWIAKAPALVGSNTSTPREWKIRIANWQVFHGGN